MKKNMFFIVLLFVSYGILFSCGYTKNDANNYLPGHYYYQIPTGILQELTINNDFTFKQIIYSKNKKRILYTNSGIMHVNSENIEFENWLECYELNEQELLLKPYITYSMNIYWEKPKGIENVRIVMFDQTNYIFKKLK